MSRCLVIINPVSGGGRARQYAMELQWQLSTLFDTIEVKFTSGAGDATRFAYEASRAGFDAVFCMGGDGTVNETVNGVAQDNCRVNFGFVPVGTVNDMSRALGMPQDPMQAIHALKDHTVRKVDIGRCNDKFFCNNIAAGVIPRVIEDVTPKEKAMLGPLAYFLRGGQALFSTRDYTFHIKTEGFDRVVRSPLIIALLTNCVSSFEQFMPVADVDDGYMRIIIFKEFFIMNIFRIIPLILNGSIYSSKYITLLKVKKCEIEAIDPQLISTNMDGDRGPLMPVSMEILPRHLKVIVPRHARPKKMPITLSEALHLKKKSNVLRVSYANSMVKVEDVTPKTPKMEGPVSQAPVEEAKGASGEAAQRESKDDTDK